jgi:hypothetical protein
MAKRRVSRASAAGGYSLLEVLVSMVFLTVAALSVMQAISVAAKAYSFSERHWHGTVERWNRAVGLRADPPLEGQDFLLASEVPPLHRHVLPAEGTGEDWEVLIAQR